MFVDRHFIEKRRGGRTDDERLRAAWVLGENPAHDIEVEGERVRRVAVRVERRASCQERVL